MAIFRPGTGAFPFTVICPYCTDARPSSSPITASIAVLFPEPDWPTIPVMPPSSTVKLISFTISDAPSAPGYCTLRFFTSSTFIGLLFLS